MDGGLARMKSKLMANLGNLTSRAVMHRMAWGILIFGMAFAVTNASADDLLTKAAEIRSLTTEQAAQKISVCITGVVTLAEPNWWGRFIMQDPSGGVFVDNTDNPHPVPGDVVQVSGVTDPGGFTRDIVSPHWKILGEAPLPTAIPISAREFMSGTQDAQRVEITGVVKAAKISGTRLDLALESGGYTYQALPSYANALNADSLVGAKVRVRGTVATGYDPMKKQLTSVAIFIPRKADFIVEQVPGKATAQKAAATDRVLTNAIQILSLTPEHAAKAIPVLITGVVTAAQPSWGGRFFIQDKTCGVFVDSTLDPPPAIGDLVQVDGVTSPGGYAPDIESPHWKKLGTAPLPEAKPVSLERFMSGTEDGERIELTGLVRSAKVINGWLRVELQCGGDRAHTFVPLPSSLDPDSLAGATVRIRGTAAASFNATLRRMLTVFLFAPQDSDLIVDQLPNPGMAYEPITSLDRIAQYRRNSFPDSRVRVEGVVTYQRQGEDIFLQDATGGLQVKYNGTNIFAPGEVIDAVGFPSVERFMPVLEDATVYPTEKSKKAIIPTKASMQELILGYHHSDIISLEGKLVDRSLSPAATANSLTNSEEESVLTFESDRHFFTVEPPATKEFGTLASIPIGSTLEISGVCLLQTRQDGKIESVRILPIDGRSVHVLQKPSWWTSQRLMAALGTLFVLSLVGTTVTVMIHRKNVMLKASISETVKAQEELQKAHSQLESRVVERTQELKFEMGARKEAEIQFKAVLAERTRLARELHDTLLQGFAGIGLRLDAVTNKLPASMVETKEEMEEILEQSDEYLTEARRSVWQLRSSALQAPGDFPKAMQKVSERAVQGTGISLRFTTYGIPYKIAPEVEDNFLRICEEAVTNAVKHANPGEVEVTLEYTARELRLQIQDDGRGFDLDGPEAKKNGHFGLIGIRERAKRLMGNLSLSSQPGQGTEIIIALSQSPEVCAD
jgi:signal transduction histidine kinase